MTWLNIHYSINMCVCVSVCVCVCLCVCVRVRVCVRTLQEKPPKGRHFKQRNLPDLEERSEHPWRDLFLWAVLQNRQQMANYFWAMVSLCLHPPPRPPSGTSRLKLSPRPDPSPDPGFLTVSRPASIFIVLNHAFHQRHARLAGVDGDTRAGRTTDPRDRLKCRCRDFMSRVRGR